MRRFVFVGQLVSATGDFLLDDIAGTSGRLDVLLRAARAAMLVSHGLRPDVVAYLVFLGGPHAPRTLRLTGATIRFLRPDERNFAGLVQKALMRELPPTGDAFVEIRTGLAISDRGLDVVLGDMPAARPYVLDADGVDVRAESSLGAHESVFFVGDHLGFDEATRSTMVRLGAQPISVGPTVVHAEDAVAVLTNELDRREALSSPTSRAASEASPR
jgi:tRNA (pseudouridine54-N1)-methyltransferase